MADLFVSMYGLYYFVVKAGRLLDIDEKRVKLLRGMSLQTAECAYFIRDKAQVENFCEDGTFDTLIVCSIQIMLGVRAPSRQERNLWFANRQKNRRVHRGFQGPSPLLHRTYSA